jgi:LacI family transcriptional regulator
MATISDVAQRAGVSTATVSHVINGTRNVLPKTRAAVEAAVRELHYRPSAVARGMQTGLTRTVGVLVADVTSFFFAQIVRELEAAFEPQHYNLMLCNTDEQPEREARYLEMLFDKRVDGVIMVPTGVPQPTLQQFVAQRVPVVSLHRKPSPATAVGPAVLLDDVAAAYMATEYLIQLGHRRIGVLARSQHLSPVVERVEGYKRALLAHGITSEPGLIETNHQTPEQTKEAALRLLQLQPTALIGMSLVSTLGALRALRELNVSYPDQISMAGIGDAPWMEVLAAPLTVVAAPVDEMCQTAARLVLDAIRASRSCEPKRTAEASDVLLSPLLIERSSCREIRN